MDEFRALHDATDHGTDAREALRQNSASPQALEPLSPLRDGFVKTALDFQRALIEFQMQVQRNQFQIYAQWLRSIGALSQEAWDQWACRFGGGVPLDG